MRRQSVRRPPNAALTSAGSDSLIRIDPIALDASPFNVDPDIHLDRRRSPRGRKRTPENRPWLGRASYLDGMPTDTTSEYARTLDRIEQRGEFAAPEGERGEGYQTRINFANDLFRGKRIRVPKGTEIRSLNPAKPRGWFPVGRTQTVTVNHVLLAEDGTLSVSWPGSSGYWHDVHARNVTLA
jgi:hypothetical protein